MISLNDAQLKTVMAAASSDGDVGDAVKRALVGLVHETAA